MAHNKLKKIQLDEQEAHAQSSTLETMDVAMFNYVNEQLNPFCTTNKGWNKVPIIWATAERAKQTKDRLDSREESVGTLIFPIITIERTGVTKDLSRKGPYWANVPSPDGFGKGNVLTVARKINQDKTGNHQNAYRLRDRKQLNFKIAKRDKRTVWRYERIPQPIYLDVEYQVKIRTEYQQQMNEISQVFMRIGEGINHDMVEHEKHRYEIFVDSGFSQENNISNMAEEERKYETTVSVKMLGKLIGLGDNQEFPQVQYIENAIEYKLPKEEVIWADPFLGKGKINPWDE
jgi:hypothetical protein